MTTTESFDEDMAEAAKNLVNDLVGALAGSPQAEDELQIHLDRIFALVKHHKISETSKIRGEVQLTLGSEQGELYSRVLVDETCIWSPHSEAGQSPTVFFAEKYPNFPTEYPLKLMVMLVSCKLPWELVTFRKTPGFLLKVYRDESQQELIPKTFQTDPSPTGQLFGGDGNGKVDQIPLWASYTCLILSSDDPTDKRSNHYVSTVEKAITDPLSVKVETLAGVKQAMGIETHYSIIEHREVSLGESKSFRFSLFLLVYSIFVLNRGG